jgi:uncharacterized protein (DUF952 family)
MNIDISQGFAHYSTQELISYSDAGILYCGDMCLSDFVDKLIEFEEIRQELKYTEEDMEEVRYEGERDGIRQAINALESL